MAVVLAGDAELLGHAEMDVMEQVSDGTFTSRQLALGTGNKLLMCFMRPRAFHGGSLCSTSSGRTKKMLFGFQEDIPVSLTLALVGGVPQPVNCMQVPWKCKVCVWQSTSVLWWGGTGILHQ
jgi:hypothetical protein